MSLAALVRTAAMPEASEVGSRTLSRFGGGAEQIYLVIRDHQNTLRQSRRG